MNQMRFILMLAMLISVKAFSQATSATAIVLTPTAYLDATPGVPTLISSSLVLGTAQTFPSCVGSQSVAWFRVNIPVAGNSTLDTRSLKVTVNTSAFSPVIDFYDASVTWRECVTGGILRTNPTTNPIIAPNDFYIRVSSTSISTGASFSIGVETYPVAEVRSGYWPTATTIGDTDGYSSCDQIRRNNVTNGNALIQNQRWVFTPTTTPNSGACTHILAGSGGIQLISNLPCICYGINFNVSVEFQLDGHWCGVALTRPVNMQAAPTTTITTPSGSTVPLGNTVSVASFCPGASVEWEFLTQNGTYLYITTPGTALPLSAVSCIQFNRIYQLRARLTECGITGPWCGVAGANSNPCIIFTPPMPTIPVPNGPAPNDFCFSQVPINSFIDVDFYAGVTQYIFQFTRVNNASPFTPIATPTIVFSNTSGCLITAGQCVANRTYRVGIKPGLNSCNSPQQGDYSPWCYFSVAPAPAPIQAMPTMMDELEKISEEYVKSSIAGEDYLDIELFGYGEQKILNISTNGQEVLRTGDVVLYDLNGRAVYQQTMYGASGVTMIQLELPADLASGIYIARVKSDSRVQSGKIFIPGANN